MYRILYIVPNLYSSSGVTKVILNYITSINKAKFKIDILVLENISNNCEDELKKMGCDIFYLKNNFKNYFNLKKEVCNFFKKNDYSTIELHAPNFSFLFLKQAKKVNIRNRIVHTHSSVRSLNFMKNLIWKLINFNMNKYANYFFSCSEMSGKYWFGKKNLKKDNFFIIPNGSNIENIKENKNTRKVIRERYGISDCFVLGYVGRISKEKNINFLINVLKKIDDESIKLLLVGDILSPKLYKRIMKNNNKIICVGYQENVIDYYNAIDLLALPSKREGLPTSIIEAQLCNTKCILSDSITHEVDIGAIDFLPLNCQKWVERIKQIKNSTEDFGKTNIDREKFNIKKNVEFLEEIYFKIIKKEEKNDI